MNQNSLLIRKTSIMKCLSTVLIAIIISGCGPSTKFIKTGKLINAKSNDCYIEVFNSKMPERKYEELGILESEGNYGYANLEDVLPELKKKACANGGDAIIIKNIQKYTEDSDEKIYVTATVIKWSD